MLHSFISILFLLTIIFDAVVVVMLLAYSKRTKQQLLLANVLLLTLIWELSLWVTFFSTSNQLVNTFASRLVFAIGPLVLVAVIYFLQTFVQKVLISKNIHRALGISALIVSMLAVVGLVVEKPVYFPNYTIPAGSLLWLYYVSYVPMSATVLYVIAKVHASAQGFKRRQFQYVLFALAISLTIVLVSNIFIPALYSYVSGDGLNYASDWLLFTQALGGVSATIWTSTTAFVVARHRLLDIRILIKNKHIQLFVLLSAALAMTGISCILFATQVFNSAILLFSMVFLTNSIGLWLISWLRRSSIMNLEFDFYKNYTPEYLKEHQTKNIIEQYSKQFKSSLESEYNLSISAFYLLDDDTQNFLNVFTDDLSISDSVNALSGAHVLEETSIRNDNALITVDALGRDDAMWLKGLLKKNNADAILPLNNGASIIGFMFIKNSDEIHFSKSITEALSSYATIFATNIAYVMAFN